MKRINNELARSQYELTLTGVRIFCSEAWLID